MQLMPTVTGNIRKDRNRPQLAGIHGFPYRNDEINAVRPSFDKR
jgi:hypothetical protein